MKDFFEKNKIPLSIIAAGLLVALAMLCIAGAIWLSNKPASVSPQEQNAGTPTPQQPA